MRGIVALWKSEVFVEDDPVYIRLRPILADLLKIDQSQIRPESQLRAHLNMESYHLCQLSYDIEEAFGLLEYDFAELTPSMLLRQDNRFTFGDTVTAKGVAFLKKELPWLDFTGVTEGCYTRNLLQLITVAALVKSIRHKLDRPSSFTPVPNIDYP